MPALAVPRLPVHVRCEAWLLDQLREVEHGTVKLHPRILKRWKADPWTVVAANVRFKPGLGWVGETNALLHGSIAKQISADPDLRLLEIDGWTTARMIRSIEEIQVAGPESYEWLTAAAPQVNNSGGELQLIVLTRFRQLEKIKSSNEVFVAKVALHADSHEVFGVFREAAGRIYGMVSRPSFSSTLGNESLLIALPVNSLYATEFLRRVSRVPNVKTVTLELMSVESFSALAHEDASWIVHANLREQNQMSAESRDELNDSSVRFSLLELDDYSAPIDKRSSSSEPDPSTVRFSLLELE